MDESGSRDLELLLLAVQHGVLSNTQVEECLKAWELKHGVGPGASPPPLQDLAVSKGYVSADKLKELDVRRSDPGVTAVRLEVVMGCRECGTQKTLSLEAALGQPRCGNCGGVLRFFKQASGVKTTVHRGPMPDDVRKALQDPHNRFAKYVLLSKLGVGGMGEVWRAWDTVLNRSVALKFPRTTGEEEIRRLYLEAQGAGGLNHPNLASIYEIAEAEGRHYIAMQFIEGKTAEEVTREATKPETREIVRWVRDAALGVHYAHERGVIHRDLKPANVMIDKEGRVYVMDFGLAKLTGGEGSGTVSGVILGTPAFMPPEQAAANAGQVDRRSDVYSLGATLYVLLSGKRPFQGESATDILVQILTSEPAPLKQAWPEAPWELDAIVARAMARLREGRYQTAKEMAEDLDRYLAAAPIQAERQTLSRQMVRKARRKGGAIATAAIVLILAVAAGYFYVRSQRPAGPSGPDRLSAWSELFPRIQRAVAVDTFDPAEARPLLDRTDKEFPEQKAAVAILIDREHRDLLRTLEALPRTAWLESAARVRRARDWLEFAKKPTEPADRILKYRGTVTLTAQVSPYAEIRGAMVEGLPAEERLTPFMRKDLEIRDGGLEFVHPTLGTRAVALPALRPGGIIVIEGRMDDPNSIKVSEGP